MFKVSYQHRFRKPTVKFGPKPFPLSGTAKTAREALKLVSNLKASDCQILEIEGPTGVIEISELELMAEKEAN